MSTEIQIPLETHSMCDHHHFIFWSSILLTHSIAPSVIRPVIILPQPPFQFALYRYTAPCSASVVTIAFILCTQTHLLLLTEDSKTDVSLSYSEHKSWKIFPYDSKLWYPSWQIRCPLKMCFYHSCQWLVDVRSIIGLSEHIALH